MSVGLYIQKIAEKKAAEQEDYNQFSSKLNPRDRRLLEQVVLKEKVGEGIINVLKNANAPYRFTRRLLSDTFESSR